MTEPETIAAQRLAKLREAVEHYCRDLGVTHHGIVIAAVEYISALDQPAPESNKCAECERLREELAYAQDAYLNMRNFAESKGLDTTCAQGRASAESEQSPARRKAQQDYEAAIAKDPWKAKHLHPADFLPPRA